MLIIAHPEGGCTATSTHCASMCVSKGILDLHMTRTDVACQLDEICAAMREIGLILNATTLSAGHAARLGCGCSFTRSRTRAVGMYVVDAAIPCTRCCFSYPVLFATNLFRCNTFAVP